MTPPSSNGHLVPAGATLSQLPLQLPLTQPTIIKQVLDIDTRRLWWKHMQTRSKDALVKIENQSHRKRNDQLQRLRSSYGADRLLHDNDDDADFDSDFYEDNGVYEGKLLPTLKQLEKSYDSLYVTSIGSSCSLDQLPIHDYVEESLFGMKGGSGGGKEGAKNKLRDLLPEFSTYLPIHDTLVISSNMATSTLCSNTHTSIILNIGGGTIDYKFCNVATSGHDEKADIGNLLLSGDESYCKSISRTWNGYEFSFGYNSPLNLFDENEDETPTLAETTSTVTSYPGDVIVVPSSSSGKSWWWYQSCANDNGTTTNLHEEGKKGKPKPNISIHSKRCCRSYDLPHILQHNNIQVDVAIMDENRNEIVKELFNQIENEEEEDND